MPDITLAYVNAYVIQGNSRLLLVDAGWNTPETLDSLRNQLAEIGADIKDISQIVVTHVHPDHYGLAGRVKQLSGAGLLFHDSEKGFIDSRYVHMDALLEQTTHWLHINGVPPKVLVKIRDSTVGLEQYIVPTYPDVTLYGGETITAGKFTFRVLWTPGHSSGHICLYEPTQKVLIAGDHILPTITPNIGLHPQSIENPLGRYLNSLEDLKKMDINLVLPGHERPFAQLRTRIDELIRHHEQRNQEILATINGEAKTAYQIAMQITWGDGESLQAMPLFHRRLALSETLAHLEMMTINGQINKSAIDDIIYYRQN